MSHLSKLNRIQVQDRAAKRKVDETERAKFLESFYRATPPPQGEVVVSDGEEVPEEVVDVTPEMYAATHAKLRVEYMSTSDIEKANRIEKALTWLGVRIAQ